MEYTTVFESYQPNQIHILRSMCEQYGIRCRVLKAPKDKVWPKGMKLQVDDSQKALAFQVMKENGFMGNRFNRTSDHSGRGFWIYLFIGLILIALVAALVASLL